MENNSQQSPASTEQDFDPLTVDAKALKELLESGAVTALGLVRRYVAQIQEHDAKFHAMIRTTPIDLLEEHAKLLDRERASGQLRGPLHGIPIIIKVRYINHQ